MKYKIIFFDCDGVLLFGHPLSKLEKDLGVYDELSEQWKGYYGNTVKFDDWIKNIGLLYKKANLTQELYLKVMNLRNYHINPEAEVLIKYLKENNYKIAIVSSGSAEYVSEVAKHLDIEYFRVNTILDFYEDGEFKGLRCFGEDPQVKVDHIREICNLLNLDSSESIFIGDSDNDIKAFEFTKHGILYGDERLDLEKHAWKRISDLREVIKILEDAN